jgi:SAM-dependent methyltransferase
VSADELFDRPARWRREAISTLGLDGEDRIAGAVTGAGYPDALEPAVQRAAAGQLWGDIGAGLGAASSWLAIRSGATVIAVEPERTSAVEAATLFPELPMIVGDAGALPLATATLDGVTLLGVLSLVADLEAALTEAQRVVRANGHLVISDLWSVPAAPDPEAAEDNVFRPVGRVVAAIEAMGATVDHVWLAPGDLPTDWDEIGGRVDEEMARAHGDDPAFDAWHDDRARLRHEIAAGRLRVATVVSTLG